LKHSVCPILAVPAKPAPFRHVIIAYDGSLESAKALRGFVNRFHPKPGDFHLTLLTVQERGQDAKPIQKEALDYLAAWNLTAETVVQGGKPRLVILERARSVTDPLVVMGAYGKGGITDLFFGSAARRLIEDSTIPLFVYH
ncbi:MAG: universal stress protein, partial [Fidelibacterota bacterium]